MVLTTAGVIDPSRLGNHLFIDWDSFWRWMFVYYPTAGWRGSSKAPHKNGEWIKANAHRIPPKHWSVYGTSPSKKKDK